MSKRSSFPLPPPPPSPPLQVKPDERPGNAALAEGPLVGVEHGQVAEGPTDPHRDACRPGGWWTRAVGLRPALCAPTHSGTISMHRLGFVETVGLSRNRASGSATLASEKSRLLRSQPDRVHIAWPSCSATAGSALSGERRMRTTDGMTPASRLSRTRKKCVGQGAPNSTVHEKRRNATGWPCSLDRVFGIT